MNESLNKVAAFFDSMYGAPGVLVVLITCNLLGYFLKMTAWCQNRNIPKWVVAWGIIGNVLFRALPLIPAGLHPFAIGWLYAQHFGRLVAIGFAIGVISSIIYDKWLKQLEDKYPALKAMLASPEPDPLPPAPAHSEKVTIETTTSGTPPAAQPPATP